ncbi:hypothetical protein JST97_16820 [bacterium]|nr:hypothetical protein [bacterium]
MAVLGLAGLLVGCGLDPRPKALRRGIDQVRSVLAEPKLRSLAEKESKGPLEDRLVDALFSASGRLYWPPRLAAEVNFSIADQSRLPGRIAYLREPELPWAVVVKADAKNHRIWLLGYGMSLAEPLLQDSVSINP